MIVRKLKVFMLGWEFPPFVNGGLGVACYGIAKELSKKVDLTLVIPKSTTDFKLQNLHLIGLNEQDITKSKEDDQLIIQTFEALHSITTELDPYDQKPFIEKDDSLHHNDKKQIS